MVAFVARVFILRRNDGVAVALLVAFVVGFTSTVMVLLTLGDL